MPLVKHSLYEGSFLLAFAEVCLPTRRAEAAAHCSPQLRVKGDPSETEISQSSVEKNTFGRIYAAPLLPVK